MATRTLGIIRRKSLSDVAECWDDCFITYRPADIPALKELKTLDTDGLDDDTGLDFIISFIERHTVGGQIMLVDESGALVAAKLEKADIAGFPQDVLMGLIADISGAK